VLQLLQRLGSQLMEQHPNEWEKCKRGLAKTLSDLKPELRNKVFFEPVGEENLQLLKQLLTDFPKEELINIYSQSYKEKKVSIDQIRDSIRKLFVEENQKEELIEPIKKQLEKDEMSKKDLDWVFQESFEQLKPEIQIEKMLNIRASDYFILHKEIDLKKFFGRLLQDKRKNDFTEITEKIAGFYENSG
jgi:hypothetical protein